MTLALELFARMGVTLVILVNIGCASVDKIPPQYDRTASSDTTTPKRSFMVGVRYYECHFLVPHDHGSTAITTGTERSLVLRFAVNSRRTLAFRNDVGPARRLQLIADESSDLVLLDYLPNAESSLLTVGKGGRAVFSHHTLGQPVNTSRVLDKDTADTYQAIGTCLEMQDLASDNHNNVMLALIHDN